MSKLNRVVDFYAAQLQDLDLEIVGDGLVSFKNTKDGTMKPVTVSGARLALPTKTILDKGDYEGLLVFHPLAEQFGTSLSPVLNALKSYVQMSLSRKYLQLIVSIATVASDPTTHKSLGVKIGKLIGEFGEMDDKTLKAVIAITRKASTVPEHRVVNVLMRNGTKEKTLRTTVITSPILDTLKKAIEEDNREPLGVAVRKRDLEPIYNLFEYVVGNEAIIESSDDRTAPYYITLMNAFTVAATKIESMITMFKSKIPTVKSIGSYGLEWVGELGDGWDEFAKTHHGVAPVLNGSRPVVEDEAVQDPLEAKREEVYQTEAIGKPAERSINDLVVKREEPVRTGGAKRSINDWEREPRRDREREPRRDREREPRRDRSIYSDDRDQSRVRTGKRSISINDFDRGGSSRGRSRRSGGGGSNW